MPDQELQNPVQESPSVEEQELAEWSSAFINDLPDSSFLYIAPGGKKDEDGKTTPRALRYFPFKDGSGKIDLPHLRNAISRIPQSTADGLTRELMNSIQEKAREMLKPSQEESTGEKEVSYSEWTGLVHLTDEYGDDNKSWIEIVRSGVHFGRNSDRRVELKASDIESMARGYLVIKEEGWFNGGAPVGYNHASINGALDAESTKAAGRIIDVEVRANEDSSISLWGLVSWTSEAKTRIRNGEFDGFSVEAVPLESARSKKSGKPLGEWALIGGTLTNEPFVPGMSRVAAAENQPTRSDSKMSLSKLLAGHLSLNESATDADVLAAVHALAEAAERAEALSEDLKTVSADRDVALAELSELREKDTERMLERALADGRIAAGEKERYLNSVTKLGEDEANYTYFSGRIPVSEVGNPGVEAERVAVNAHGLESEAKALAESFVNDLGLDEATAYGRAISIVLSDPTKLAAYEAESVNS